MNEKPLRVLVIDDGDEDAEAMVRQLEKEGFAVRWRRVENSAVLSAALEEEEWDLILADYDLPGRSAEKALDVNEALRARTAALQERVKELRCLYAANELLREKDLDAAATWEELVRLVPRGWRYPETTEARLRIGDVEHVTEGWTGRGAKLRAPIETGEGPGDGVLEVTRTGHEDRDAGDGAGEGEEPFLEEERELIDALAFRIGESLRRWRAEEKLREREALFRTVTQNSADVIVIMDRELQVRFRTPGGPGPLHYDLSAMEGAGFFRQVHPEDRAELREALHQMIQEEEPTLRTTYRVFHPETGETLEVEAAAVNLLDEAAVRGIVVNVRDMTEQRAAERRLRFQADLLDAVGQAIVATDLEGRITYWGGGAEEVFGWAPQEVLGRDVLEVTPAEDTVGQAREIMKKLRAGGSWLGEFSVRRKNGAVFPAIVSNHPLTDEVGELIGIVGITTDVTDLKEAEASLRESEERFRALIENSEDLVAILDPEGTILYLSPSVGRLLGLEPSERVGKNIFRDSIMNPEDEPAARGAFLDAVSEPGVSRPVRFRVRNGAGELRTIEGTLTNLTHLPAVRGIVMNGRDVTEREELERELLQSQRIEAVGRLAGGVAHDFNNILTSIQGFTRIVLEETPDEDARREDLEEVLRQAERAAELTNQLLAYSRRQMLVPKVLDLRASLQEMNRMLSRLIGEDILLSVALPEEPLFVRVDPAQLEQVVVNLVVNARDAMPDGGELRMEARERELGPKSTGVRGLAPGPYVEIVVEDTGHGMKPEVLERVFDPFFTTKPAGEGTGLGLATVIGVIKQSDGDVQVSSVPGEGTRFSILLPKRVAPEVWRDPEGERRLPGDVLRARKGESVLVAEDDQAVGRVIERVLARRGYEVWVCGDGKKALALLDDGVRPSLLLTDMVMPGLGGHEVAKRARDRLPGLPVIYMTGYTEDEMARRGIAEELEHFLSKPFDFDELLAAVRTALDEKGAA